MHLHPIAVFQHIQLGILLAGQETDGVALQTVCRDGECPLLLLGQALLMEVNGGNPLRIDGIPLLELALNEEDRPAVGALLLSSPG